MRFASFVSIQKCSNDIALKAMVYGHAQQSDDYKENLGLHTRFLGCSKMSRSMAWQLTHGDEGNEKMSDMRLTAAICLFRYLFEKNDETWRLFGRCLRYKVSAIMCMKEISTRCLWRTSGRRQFFGQISVGNWK